MLMKQMIRGWLGGWRLTVAAMALCAVAFQGPALAQGAYPNRPIKLMVMVPAGNSADLMARMIADRLSRGMGQPVLVENRPGASGAIGMAALGSTPADGYTIGIGGIGQLALNPSLYTKLPYDPKNGFGVISVVYKGPFLFLVDAASPYANLKELVQAAAGQAKGMDYTSAGSASAMHLAAELFRKTSGANILHVPSRGTGQAANLVLGKHAPLMVENSTAAMSFVKSGQLRALAVSSAQRLGALPNVPTLAEAGFPGLVMEGWLTVITPAGVPAEVRDRLSAELSKVMADPELQAWIASTGGFAENMGPGPATAYVRAEASRWADVVQSIGLKLD